MTFSQQTSNYCLNSTLQMKNLSGPTTSGHTCLLYAQELYRWILRKSIKAVLCIFHKMMKLAKKLMRVIFLWFLPASWPPGEIYTNDSRHHMPNLMIKQGTFSQNSPLDNFWPMYQGLNGWWRRKELKKTLMLIGVTGRRTQDWHGSHCKLWWTKEEETTQDRLQRRPIHR